MNYGELVQMYFERSNALQWYWTLYVVIIGGLLGVASMRKQPDLVTTTLVTVLFAFFAYKNLGAIVDVSVQRLAILEAVKGSAAGITASGGATMVPGLIGPTLSPPDIEGIKHFHWASDGLTILALWAMELRRRRTVRNDGV